MSSTVDTTDPSDECTKEPKGYKGNEFVTDALRHSKVKLTWDQDDPNRAKITRRALTREEIEEEDFGNLVAASESEEEDDDDEDDSKKSKKQKIKERRDKLRALLLGGDDETGDIWGKAGTAWKDELADMKGDEKESKDVEITFRPGLTTDDNLTSLERYQLRMKEKKKAKKEKRELKGKGEKEEKDTGDDFFGNDGDEPARSPSPDVDDHKLVEDQSHHFSLKDHVQAEKIDGKKRKRSRKKAERERERELGPDGFKVDVSDPRFAAMYDEPAFAVDPTHPKFQDIQANREILQKTRERHTDKRARDESEKDLSSLVESVKAKMGGKRKRSRKH